MKRSAMLLVGISTIMMACGGKGAPTQTTTQTTSSALTAQVERGKGLYAERCAECHGDAGQGTDKAPAVVGSGVFPLKPREGSKRDVDFKSAADVFTWASKTMPGNAPGTLSTDELLAVFAFDLTANGVKLTAPLDAATAAAINLH